MDYSTKYHRPTPVGLTCSKPSLTRSEFKSQVSVNNMIARLLGGDSSVIRRGIYIDATKFDGDFHDLQNRLASARSLWANLPEKVRAAYGSPENLLSEVDKSIKTDDVTPSTAKSTKTDDVTPSTAKDSTSAATL